MRRAALVLLIAVWGCSPTPISSVQSTVNVSLVGPAGGTVPGQGDLSGGLVNIPPGALLQPTPIAIGDDPQPPADPSGFSPAGPSMLCSPEGVTFNKPVQVLVPYYGTSDVSLWTAPAIPDAGWEVVDGGVADDVEKVAVSSVSHFSRFRAYRITVPPPPPDGG